MKKNVRKKLLSLIVCAALVLAMAVPAFADWQMEPDHPTSHSPNRLNVYGNLGSYMQGRQLTLWTDTGSADQRFVVQKVTYDGEKCMYLLSSYDTRYAINRSTQSVAGGKLAIMWTLSDGKYDSLFRWTDVPDPSGVLFLRHYNEGLCYTGDYSGATVFFGPGSGPWLISGTPTIPDRG